MELPVTREQVRREGKAKEAAKNPLEREERETHITPKPLSPTGEGREKDKIILKTYKSM